MYYAIELYEGKEITLKTVKMSHLHEIVEDARLYKDRKIFYSKDCITVIEKNQLTSYYISEERRNNMVEKLLNSRYKKSVAYLNDVA